MKPALYFFTRETSLAWSSMAMFVWITPMPPVSKAEAD